MSIGGDGWSEVAAILICVNNWGRLCGNVVEASPGSVSRAMNNGPAEKLREWSRFGSGSKRSDRTSSPRALFRRKSPPTGNRNPGTDQGRDRTGDGPGCGVAHLATAEHSESLQRPDQAEHCDDQSEHEGNDRSPSHRKIVGPIRITPVCGARPECNSSKK